MQPRQVPLASIFRILDDCRGGSWWLILATMIVARMILTAPDEIVATNNDANNYAYLAAYYLSGMPSDLLPAQRAGIGILAQLTSAIGIPYKLALDACFLVTVFFAAEWTRRWTDSTWLSLLVFGLLCFNPWFGTNARTFLSEPLTAVLCVWLVLGAAGSLSRPIGPRPPRIPILLTLAGMALVMVRPEELIVYAFACLVAVVALGRSWLRGTRRPLVQWLRWGLILLLPVGGAWTTLQVWKMVHARHYGLAALTRPESPGVVALLNALYSIRPDELIRFAPVPHDSLRAACGASPTLAKYQAKLLADNTVFHQVAQEALGIQGEIGTWLNWHLIDSMGGIHVGSDAEMRRAAAEIRAAQQAGRLPRRAARYPIDPDWQAWLGTVAPTWWQALQLSVFPPSAAPRSASSAQESRVKLVDRGVFDRGLLRRRGTYVNAELRIYLATKEAASPYHRVRVIGPRQNRLGANRIVPAASGGMQFEFVGNAADLQDTDRVTLQFLEADANAAGPAIELPLHGGWTVHSIGDPPGGQANGKQVPVWSAFGIVTRPGDSWRERTTAAIHRGSGILLFIGVIVSFGLGWWQPRCRRRIDFLSCVLIVGWGLVCGRSLFYALVEVWLRWGLHRYVGPQQPLIWWVLVLTAFWLGNQLRRAGWLQSLRPRRGVEEGHV